MDIKQFKSGLLEQPKDKRDWKLKDLIPVKAMRIPNEYCPDRSNVPVFDQGQTYECCACAYSTIRFIQEQSQSGLREPFAPSFTYANRPKDETIMEGMYLRSCCKQGRYGSVLWREMPWFGTVDKCVNYFTNHKTELLHKAENYKISSFYTAHTIDEMKMGICITGGLLIGVTCYDSLFTPDENGIVKYNEFDKEHGGHAMAILGYKYIDNIPYWIIRNSWGEKYGKNGNVYISFDDLQKMLIDSPYVIVDADTRYMYEEYKNRFYPEKKTFLTVIKEFIARIMEKFK